MPDSFFAAKSRKRKRSSKTNEAGPSKPTKTPRRTGGRETASGRSKLNGAPNGKRRHVDEELESDITGDEDAGDMDLRAVSESEGSGEEDETETPAQKRLRLAKLYLASVKENLADGEVDAAEIDKEIISSRLRQDVLEHSGKVHLHLAETLDFSQSSVRRIRMRGHRYSVTCAKASIDGRHLFTAGKEGSIIKWDIYTGKRLHTMYKQTTVSKGTGKQRAPADVQGHTDEVLALALSGDGKTLASGGKDRRIGLWDIDSCTWIRSFGGHKDLISNLAFRKGTNQLYSSSFDRSIKLHDLSPNVMGYVETLFGHQDTILGLDALRAETAVSVGGRDRTARFWKIVDESQLVFRGGGRSAVKELLDAGMLDGEEEQETIGLELRGKKDSKGKRFVEGSIECIAMIDETTFITGGDSGSICLWNTQKKKPVYTQALAHGFHETHSETEGLLQTPRWITAVASLHYSDVFVSGSWDGSVRVWTLDRNLKAFTLAGMIAIPGIINSLQLIEPSPDAKLSWVENGNTTARSFTVLLVAGVGQEYRFGRWMKVKEGGAVNGTVLVALRTK